jgi:hypothetical protein
LNHLVKQGCYFVLIKNNISLCYAAKYFYSEHNKMRREKTKPTAKKCHDYDDDEKGCVAFSNCFYNDARNTCEEVIDMSSSKVDSNLVKLILKMSKNMKKLEGMKKRVLYLESITENGLEYVNKIILSFGEGNIYVAVGDVVVISVFSEPIDEYEWNLDFNGINTEISDVLKFFIDYVAFLKLIKDNPHKRNWKTPAGVSDRLHFKTENGSLTLLCQDGYLYFSEHIERERFEFEDEDDYHNSGVAAAAEVDDIDEIIKNLQAIVAFFELQLIHKYL